MNDTVNLDRSAGVNIRYPLGVKEKITFINNDVGSLDDTYQITIAKRNGTVLYTYEEADSELTKVDNKLIWDVNYEHNDAKIRVGKYDYQIRNKTQDWIEFDGCFEVTKTIDNG